MRITKVLPSSSAEAEILTIYDHSETVDGLRVGDVVFIGLSDMKTRDIPFSEGDPE